MNIPKIIFKPMSLEENINVIKWAYYEGNGDLSVYDYTIKYFPMLAGLENSSKEEVYKKIEEVVTHYYLKSKDRIDNEVNKYNNWWIDYNDEYFAKLSDYFNIEFPDEIKLIEAEVGLIPVFPRYLDTYSFAIGVGVDEDKLIETCAHETLHFLWFRKWKELYPDTKREEYESPYFVWKYSEIVEDPILNNKPFSDMFKFEEHVYDSFYELSYEGKKVIEVLRDIYKKDIPIEEKIKNGFEYLEKALKEDS